MVNAWSPADARTEPPPTTRRRTTKAGLWGSKDQPKHGRPTTTDDTNRQRSTKRYTWGVGDPKPKTGKGRRKATKPNPNRWAPNW